VSVSKLVFSLRGVLALLVGVGFGGAALAQDAPAIVVNPNAKAQRFRAALQRFAERSVDPSTGRANRFRGDIGKALEFSSFFDLVSDAAYLAPTDTQSLAKPNWVCADWTQISADVFVEGELEAAPGGGVSANFHVWDTASCKAVLRKRYRQAAGASLESIAKRIADDIVQAFVGVRGVSATEIAFVSDRGGSQEIWVMDADGGHARGATRNRSLNNFPGWSPSGDAILYTSYRMKNRPHVFQVTRGGGRPPGLLLPSSFSQYQQYRAVYHPSGGSVAAVLSVNGNQEIFRFDLGSGYKRLTNSRAIEVSPTWSPDGSKIAFVSDRTGAPQVYLMNSDGSNQQRLTYTGTYNTAPTWSPDGAWIAYETRIGGQMDIWLVDPASGDSHPLVEHPRGDEGPSWAPNGRLIAFSSTRRGRGDIYVSDLSGQRLFRVTEGAGNNKAPAWGPFPR
jgi:TolB protein